MPQSSFGLGLRGSDRFAPQNSGLDWAFGRLQLVSSFGTGADLSRFAEVLSQGQSNSCVAHAWEGALLIESRNLGFKGKIAELGSRLFGYYNSRALHGSQYTDSGTYLRSYAYALKRVGRTSESDWKFNIRKINKQPPLRVYQRAHAMAGLRGYYKIYSRGKYRLDDICTALEHGHPVVFGMRVDEEFLRKEGPITVGIPKGRLIGGHAMCIVGYDYSDGSRRFKILNSHGNKWRAGGFCWFDESLMQWDRLDDLWVASLS